MKLLPFQEKAVNDMIRILETRGGVYNAYEMRLGKTVQTIRTVEHFNVCKVLVICPAVVASVWKQEIKIWNRRIGIEWIIKSYDMAVRDIESLRDSRWDCLILDEAHKIKNHTTKRAEAVFSLWSGIPYRICLSGTPMTTSIMDCWSLFSRLAPEDFAEYWHFYRTYAKVQRTPFGEKVVGVKNTEKLKKIIRSKFFIRETLDTVGYQLPEKTWQKISLPKSLVVRMTPDQEKEHKVYTDKVIAAFKHGYPIRAKPPVSSVTWRQQQGLKKVNNVVDFGKNLLDCGTACVIFGYHKLFVEELKKGLKAFKPAVITGETNAKDREQAIGAFQEGRTDCFIGTLDSASVGINLSRANIMLLAEFSYIPSTIQQATSRIVGLGKKGNVHIYYFVVENSIEENIIDILVERTKSFQSVLKS